MVVNNLFLLGCKIIDLLFLVLSLIFKIGLL